MNKRAFTLIEVLGSIALLAIALTPLMYLLSKSLQQSRRSEQMVRVLFLAQMKMDETRAGVLSDYGTDRDQAGDFSSSGYDGYKYTVTDDNASGLKTLQVRVWYDADDDDAIDAEEDRVTLDSKIADRG